VEDVMDGLGLDRTAMLGTSFGGAILLDTAACAPQRISRAVLVVPAGLISPSFVYVAALYFRLFLPWQLYRLFPSRRRLQATARLLATDVEEDILAFMDATIRWVRWMVPPPGPLPRRDLAQFQAPALVLAAQEDVFSPLERLMPRAKELIPNLAGVEVLEGKHISGKRVIEQMNIRIDRFLRGEE
jgi:pimeloyl-ACP methyl ester carboxylesterase